MSRVNPIQTNFSTGEVSPLLRGRVDVNRYFNGVAKLENFTVRPQGGAWRRSGTKFAHEVKNSAHRVRLIDFRFSDNQAFVLEFGNQYIRFYTNGGIITGTEEDLVITEDTGEVIKTEDNKLLQVEDEGTDLGDVYEVESPYGVDDLPDLYVAQSADILYICHPDYQTRKLMRYGNTDWRIELYSPTDGPYLPINKTETTLRIVPWQDKATARSNEEVFAASDVGRYVPFRKDNEWQLGLITEFVSATEVNVTVQDSYIIPAPVVKITVSGSPTVATTTTHSDVFRVTDVGAFYREPVTNTWWKCIGFNDHQSMTVSTVDVVQVNYPAQFISVSDREIMASIFASTAMFEATDVGRAIRLSVGGQWVWGTISSWINTTTVWADMDSQPPRDTYNKDYVADNGVTTMWRLGAWSETTGWPSCVCFHEQRLCFAATEEEPQTMWMSVSGDYENMSPTELSGAVLDTSAITYTIVSNEVNSIVWMESRDIMLIGTVGGEWQVRAASSIQEPITPANIMITPQTAFGSEKVIPRRIGAAILFVERGGEKVREMTYSYELDSHIARDITLISEHIFRDGGGAVESAYQRSPVSMIWFVRADGQLIGLTYEKDQDVFAWHRHVVGGNGFVESVAVIPGENGAVDQVYLSVRRTINGYTKRYVEWIEDDFHPTNATDKSDMYFVDCGLSYTGLSTTTITGLEHLERSDVRIVGDGIDLGTAEVINGAIQLPAPVTAAHIGLDYRSTIRTLPPEGGSPFGTSQGRTKRIHDVVIRVLHSIGFSHGQEEDDLTQESFRSTGDPMDSSPPLFTGDKTITADMGYSAESDYYICQTQPYPLNILLLSPGMHTYD